MTRRIKSTFYIALSLIFFLVIYWHQLGSGENFVAKTKPLMGTMVEIKVPLIRGEDSEPISSAIEKAFAEMRRIEWAFSVFKEDSEISKVNRLKPGEKIKLSGEVYALIKRSLEYSELTAGAFDITVKPLVDLWADAKLKNRLPSQDETENARSKIGWQNVILDEASKGISFKKDGMMLDLGGIAKGYAADRAIAVLVENGVKSAIANPGGNMYCLGKRSKNEPWKIGVQHPRKRDELFLEILIEDKAAVTSGDYERYFELDGKRYSHIMDPRTGWPIGDTVVSATVIADNSAKADALATAITVLGPKEGLDILRRMKGVDALIIFKDGEELKTAASEGFEERYEIVKR